MNVQRMQHRADASAIQVVLPIMPLVRCQADSKPWEAAHFVYPVQGPQKGCSCAMDGLWALRGGPAQPSQGFIAIERNYVRRPEPDETPLSQEEAAIANRYFPN